MVKLAPRPLNLLDEFFSDFPRGLSIAPLHGDPLPHPGKFKVDVKENGDNIVVQAEIPGMKKEDIDISIDRDILTISAEVSQYDADEENDRVLHSERYYGAVQRSFTLPAEVTPDKAAAKYADGILTLTLPKTSPDGKKKKIAIG